MTDKTMQLSLGLLVPAPWNPRKTVDENELKGLVSSMADHGLIQSLIVRPITADKYEIVAGYRRYLAATKLKWETLRCSVRDLTDDQAIKLGIVDNLQRADVPPLEEADGYNDLRNRGEALTIEAIAATVGKPVAYVAQRLQLVTLAELPRKALNERLITVDHALLLAKLGTTEQNVNLKWALKPGAGVKEKPEDVLKETVKRRDEKPGSWRSYYEAQSVLELKHHIEQNVGRKLSRAPWNLDDAELVPSAGACSKCPSNTKANDALFSDMNISGATCENGACFEQKRAAFVQIKFATLPKDRFRVEPPAGSALNGVDRYVHPLRISWKATTVKPRAYKKGNEIDRDGFAPEQIFREGQWKEAKKGSCEFVRQAVTVDWSDAGDRGYTGSNEKLRKPGQVISVCIAEKCKVHRKSYTSEAPKASTNGGYDPKAEEAKREKLRAEALVESKIRMAAATKAIEHVKKMPEAALRYFILGRLPNWEVARKPLDALVPGLAKIIQSSPLDSIEFARAVAVISIDSLKAHEHLDSKQYRGEFLNSLKRIGYDGGAAAWLEAKKAEPKAPTKPENTKVARKAFGPKKPKKAAKKAGKK